MRAVVQRVVSCGVSCGGEKREIKKGLCVLLGVGANDCETDAVYIADKIVNLRIFEDEGGKMNLSARDIGAEALIVSQFTLYGDARHGKRPSFTSAAPYSEGEKLYERVCCLVEKTIPVTRGFYGGDMLVEIANDGPVTIMLDSEKLF